MATKITSIYDALDSLLSTTFPGREELIDEINIEMNDERWLKSGQCFRVFEADNTQEIPNNCATVFNRRVEVTLTGEVLDLQSSTTDKKVNDKVLLEDQKLLIDTMYTDQTLNDNISSITFLSDGGLEPVVSGKANFKMIQSLFEIKYTEFI